MSLIKTINLEKTIDYSKDSLEYFFSQGVDSALIGYQQITDKIRSAKEFVKIATTSDLADDIYDALYQNSNLNIYMMFKSFENATNTLSKFDHKKPVVAREVQELENNFIIIDNVSFLLVNPISQKENLYIEFDEKKTQDLSFIYNYYFWNCASLERLIDKVLQPVESPFPPFDNRKFDYINISKENINNLKTIVIPMDKEFNGLLNTDVDNKYFSDDIKTPIYLNDENIQIGELSIKGINFDIKNYWELKANELSDIDTSINIIPREEYWQNTIKIKGSSTVELKNIRAETIDEMENVKPSNFPKDKYIKNICFKWQVLPPIKPSNAKKSHLYVEYNKLVENFNQQLLLLEKKLKDLKQESNVFSSLLGANKKATQDINIITGYKERDLQKVKPNELREFFTKEFKSFFEGVINSEKEFKNNKRKKKAEDEWEKLKKQKKSELDKKQKEIEAIKNNLVNESNHQSKQRNELKKLESDLNILNQEIKDNDSNSEKALKYDKQKNSARDKKQKEIENVKNNIKNESNDQYKQKNKLKKLEININNLIQEIRNNYTNFDYKPKKSELSHLSNEKIHEYKKFIIPAFALPEVGSLFETNDSYYLEIDDYDELGKAKELQQRYKNKNYKVVVGEGHE
jgi:hypothetical protein